MRSIAEALPRRVRNTLLTLTALAAAVGASACSNALEVDLPGRIPTTLLNDPTTAPTLAASVVADFECAYSNYTLSTATISDQFLGASGNLNAQNWGTKKIPANDQSNARARCGTIDGGYGAYLPLQTARFQSNDILTRLNGWTDDSAKTALAPLRAKVAAYGAYAHVFLGEGYCAMRFDGAATTLSRAEVLAIAEAKFDSALVLTNLLGAADAALKADLLNLVYNGRARTRLDLGDLPGAAADAALVVAGWEYFSTRGSDTETRYNTPWFLMSELSNASVAPEYRALAVGGTPDPRVDVVDGPTLGLGEFGFDGRTPLFVVRNKNTSRASNMRLASSIEANLIRAEALGGSTAVGIINARRTELSLPTYTGATDAASIQALILDERNREFFMEGGHRLNDLLRYNIPWKTGNDQNGSPYGPTTCLPLPTDDQVG